jgi:NAD(P)H dehydrogenase (quinone)
VDAQGSNAIGDQTRNAARHQAERVVQIASALKNGLAA